MKLTTTSDVLNLIRAYITSAALGAALELRLFWRLAEQPQTVDSVAQSLSIPINRCYYWLELLIEVGLLERCGNVYCLSSAGRTGIIEAYSAETWELLAQEARERYPAGINLALHIQQSGSVWTAQGLGAPDYIAQIMENPERACRFTYMLYEMHRPMAEELAETLDMRGVQRLMDLGGGSGVISLTLLRRYPHLTAVVVDLANVCSVGREIAAKAAMSGRITYYAADFLRDELPSGFDMILECDVRIYSEALFRKLWAALNPSGRLVIVDQLSQADRVPSLSYLTHNFLASLDNPDFTIPMIADVKKDLVKAGFQPISEQILSDGNVVIQAQK